MKQRNETGYERHVSVWPSEEHPDWEPFCVGDGEETDFPLRLAGLTLVPEPEAQKPDRKGAAVAAVKKEGEPQ